jgi:hypothetical protein
MQRDTSYKLSGVVADATGAAHRTARVQFAYAVLIIAAAWFAKDWGLIGVSMAVAGVLVVEFLLLGRVALDILHLRWRDFARLHVRGLLAALSVLFVIGPLAVLARRQHFPAALTLGSCSLVCVLGALLVLSLRPSLLVGPAELWLLGSLDKQFGPRARTARVLIRTLMSRVKVRGTPFDEEDAAPFDGRDR